MPAQDTLGQRTRRYHTHKAKQVVSAVLEEIAPQDPDNLWTSLVNAQPSLKESEPQDTVLLGLLSECYLNADHWSTKRQILSIIADHVSFNTVQKWIPGITR